MNSSTRIAITYGSSVAQCLSITAEQNGPQKGWAFFRKTDKQGFFASRLSELRRWWSGQGKEAALVDANQEAESAVEDEENANPEQNEESSGKRVVRMVDIW